ncbi:hypothetical protein [Clostridium aminobutyricum]|uniref:Uncharacterized protein n=1 Tax=Clostridium aminobutyricum TaxID=33953 RepID=A0A939DAD8_CLOAM|nr:hypothetical protein [Clostridium aminobutyricum]MBN7774339.1 hypothetical protein [Clostridium aminobutyricum]
MEKNNRKIVTTRKSGATLQLIVGALLTLVFGVTALTASFDNVEDGAGLVLTFYILTALSIKMIISSRQKKELNNKVESYVARLVKEPYGSIDKLAASMGTSSDAVKKDLQELIKKKYFGTAYIDEIKNRIVLFPDSDKEDYFVEENKPEQKVAYAAISCKNCGGINKVIAGGVHECDYCGSPIES